MGNFRKHSFQFDLLRKVARVRLGGRERLSGHTHGDFFRMGGASLTQNQKALVLASTQGLLDLVGASPQMRRLFGSLGGGIRVAPIRRRGRSKQRRAEKGGRFVDSAGQMGRTHGSRKTSKTLSAAPPGRGGQ